MSQMTFLACPNCGRPLHPAALVCHACAALVYGSRLRYMAAEAQRLEGFDPAAAAMAWRQCLDLLPPDSRQYQWIAQRMMALSGFAAAPISVPRGSPANARRETWLTALAKTGGSMLVSIAAYMLIFSSWIFATGFVLLILIHELGHVAAMRYYGLSASPPFFIPFLGAIINLRQPPRNAKEEAVVGIGGPLAGTAGALACYGAYMWTDSRLLLTLSFFGFLINLFNLLPVPPLDGGRITAAISPWIWMLGVAAMGAMLVAQWYYVGHPSVILLMILFFAMPRIIRTLRGRERYGGYYQITRRASRTIAGLYLSLATLLVVFVILAQRDLRFTLF